MEMDIDQAPPELISMNTPIKKIKNLRLDSSPIYPNINEFISTTATTSGTTTTTNNSSNYSQQHGFHECPGSPTTNSMLNKGYSQRLTSTVLEELNSRANEICNNILSPPDSSVSLSSRNPRRQNNGGGDSRRSKRYSGIHFTRFKQMESITNHYSVNNEPSAVTREVRTPSPQKGTEQDGSITKRRRTLNGNDEIVAIPTMSKPTEDPSIFRKISPSKGSVNLNSMLNDRRQTTDTGSPNKGNNLNHIMPSLKSRQSSLELAGIKQPLVPGSSIQRKSSIPCLQQPQQSQSLVKKSSMSQLPKPSIPTLQKKPSISTLQKNPSSSIQGLQKKPSIPQLQRKSSIPQLQKKPSIPSLNRKSSIPQLQQHHQSQSQQPQQHTTFPPTPTITTSMPPPMGPPLHKLQKNVPNLSKMSPSKSLSISPSNSSKTLHISPSNSSKTLHISPSHSSKSLNLSPSHSSRSINISPSNSTKSLNSRILQNKTNTHQCGGGGGGGVVMPKSKSITIPQPFSLYSKPTISSSQKSIDKFQRFKERFN
ncbi:uncharacterized protein J8A68_000158 [[Candida] subhashii]|uniref:Uncharacterized protein n=1 Tax=[Candida] subhashii TaxID=561895 RepID=A0A8J5UMW3_9ASCO|nr:uncharacterized protein J8A68_000158 [[Candida] subhashii]KAG7666303.1 hypothetical protein J8A68_000158 [[Candida] subhashii]